MKVRHTLTSSVKRQAVRIFPFLFLHANLIRRPRSSPLSQTMMTIASLTKTACLRAHWTRSSRMACSATRYLSFSRSSRHCMSLSPRSSSQQTSRSCRALYKRQRQDRSRRVRKQLESASRSYISTVISARRGPLAQVSCSTSAPHENKAFCQKAHRHTRQSSCDGSSAIM
jgi:hypothetical protein